MGDARYAKSKFWNQWRKDDMKIVVPRASDDVCVIEEFFRNNPDKKYVMLSCKCRRCTPIM